MQCGWCLSVAFFIQNLKTNISALNFSARLHNMKGVSSIHFRMHRRTVPLWSGPVYELWSRNLHGRNLPQRGDVQELLRYIDKHRQWHLSLYYLRNKYIQKRAAKFQNSVFDP